MRTVMSRSSRRLIMKSQTSELATGSRPTVGSSKTSHETRGGLSQAHRGQRRVHSPAAFPARDVEQAREQLNVLVVGEQGVGEQQLRHVPDQPPHMHRRAHGVGANTVTMPLADLSNVASMRIVVVYPFLSVSVTLWVDIRSLSSNRAHQMT